MCVFSSIYRFTVKLRQCSVVYSECLWNSGSVYYFIMIVDGIAVVCISL